MDEFEYSVAVVLGDTVDFLQKIETSLREQNEISKANEVKSLWEYMSSEDFWNNAKEIFEFMFKHAQYWDDLASFYGKKNSDFDMVLSKMQTFVENLNKIKNGLIENNEISESLKAKMYENQMNEIIIPAFEKAFYFHDEFGFYLTEDFEKINPLERDDLDNEFRRFEESLAEMVSSFNKIEINLKKEGRVKESNDVKELKNTISSTEFKKDFKKISDFINRYNQFFFDDESAEYESYDMKKNSRISNLLEMIKDVCEYLPITLKKIKAGLLITGLTSETYHADKHIDRLENYFVPIFEKISVLYQKYEKYDSDNL